MCGRYSQTHSIETINTVFGLTESIPIGPRYNIAPSQPAPIIINDEGARRLDLYQWGLIPSWAKDPKIGNKMINARSETVAEKPSFKRLTKRNRCLVVADGFYEWRKDKEGKTPIRIFMKSPCPFPFAGLWDSWRNGEGKEVRSFTILTTSANPLLKEVHDRMPVILKMEVIDPWLDPKIELQEMAGIFDPYPDIDMEYSPVSKVVNSPRNDGPECWERNEE